MDAETALKLLLNNTRSSDIGMFQDISMIKVSPFLYQVISARLLIPFNVIISYTQWSLF